MYHILAGIVFMMHLAFIIFVIVGALVAWRWHWVAIPHLTSVIWGLVMEFIPCIPCPLTPLEQMLLERAGREAYQDGFIDHYIVPIIYPEVGTWFFPAAGAFLLIMNLILYGLMINRIRTKKFRQG